MQKSTRIVEISTTVTGSVLFMFKLYISDLFCPTVFVQFYHFSCSILMSRLRIVASVSSFHVRVKSMHYLKLTWLTMVLSVRPIACSHLSRSGAGFLGTR